MGFTFPFKEAKPSKAVATCAQPRSCHIICFTQHAFTATYWESVFPSWSSTLNRLPVKLNSVTGLSLLHLFHFHPLISVSFSHFSVSPRSLNRTENLSLHQFPHTHLQLLAPKPWTPRLFQDQVDLEVSHGSEAWLPALTLLPAGRRASRQLCSRTTFDLCVCVWVCMIETVLHCTVIHVFPGELSATVTPCWLCQECPLPNLPQLC